MFLILKLFIRYTRETILIKNDRVDFLTLYFLETSATACAFEQIGNSTYICSTEAAFFVCFISLVKSNMLNLFGIGRIQLLKANTCQINTYFHWNTERHF